MSDELEEIRVDGPIRVVFTLKQDYMGNPLPEPVEVAVQADDEIVWIGVSGTPAVLDPPMDKDNRFSYRITLEHLCPIKDRPVEPEELWAEMFDGEDWVYDPDEGWVVKVWADGNDKAPNYTVRLTPFTGGDETFED